MEKETTLHMKDPLFLGTIIDPDGDRPQYVD